MGLPACYRLLRGCYWHFVCSPLSDGMVAGMVSGAWGKWCLKVLENGSINCHLVCFWGICLGKCHKFKSRLRLRGRFGALGHGNRRAWCEWTMFCCGILGTCKYDAVLAPIEDGITESWGLTNCWGGRKGWGFTKGFVGRGRLPMGRVIWSCFSCGMLNWVGFCCCSKRGLGICSWPGILLFSSVQRIDSWFQLPVGLFKNQAQKCRRSMMPKQVSVAMDA